MENIEQKLLDYMRMELIIKLLIMRRINMNMQKKTQ